MNKLLFQLFFLLLSVIVLPSMCFSTTPGRPSQEKLEEWQLANQTYSITQNANDIMYFGNSFGVVEYNGGQLQLIKMPNNTIVQSVYCDAQQRVWVGAIDELGYLENDKDGNLIYQSIKSKLPETIKRSLGVILKIYELPQGIAFISTEHLLIYQEEKFTIISPQKAFQHVSIVNDTLYSVDVSGGLHILKNEQFESVAHLRKFTPNKINSILPYGEHQLLIIDNHFQCFLLKKGKVVDVPLTRSMNRFRTVKVVLFNDLYIITTADNTVIVMDKKGKIKREIKNGLGSIKSKVMTAFIDNKENLWLGTDNGVSYLNLYHQVTPISDNYNVFGIGYTAKKYKNKLFLGTSQGLYSVKYNRFSTHHPVDFQLIANSEGNVWNMDVINDHLIVGHNKGTFVYQNNQLKMINDIQGGWLMKPLNHWKGYAIQGTYSGLLVYNIEDGIPRFSHKIKGFSDSSRLIEEDENGILWISHGNKGVFKIKLSDDLKEAEKVAFYNSENGFPSDLGINVSRINEDIIFTSEHKGIYTYDYQADSFRLYTQLENLLSHTTEINKITEDQFGNFWYVLNNLEVGVLQKKIDGSYTRETDMFRKLYHTTISGFELMYPLSKDSVLLGSKNGFNLFVKEKKVNPNLTPDVYPIFDKVTLIGNPDSTLFRSGSAHQNFALPYNDNSIKINYSVPIYSDQDMVSYSYKLEGFDKEWSRFTDINFKDYTNLPAGEYTFRLKAKNIYDKQTPVVFFNFRVLPPWYQTHWAYLLYFICFLLFMYFIRLYTKRSIESKNRREKLKKDKEIIALKNEILEAKLHKNTTELAEKSTKLSAFSAQLANKKDTIEQIYDTLADLRSDVNPMAQKEIQSLINKLKLSNSEITNWQQFEVHFDEINNNFFKKLKNEYPELNATELRLCAFIKTGLSTKEIATIQNSTIRSIEAYRYRLRKKLSIDKNENLNDFLFNY
ncbi:triple tyrosine motif-containing protein [Flammeovirga sp. SubArs3]|uniref:triple tyrosine motif-containing protein n=1 Tax=Flammeovirga sp. SubArs3 TaxID=2995316 RepID=UPI00248BAF1B|nr:triple tyrosine motif-containing protein [Flammeovirga sp. SubArs3]